MKKFSMITIVLFCVILLGSCGSGTADDSDVTTAHSYIPTGQGFEFLIVADPHLLSDSLHDDKEAFQRFISFSDRLVQYADELMDVLKEDISLDPPDFMILAGDLTCNGEMESHKDLAAKLKAIEALGTSVYVVPGNHDILNPMARQFFENTIWEADYVTRDTFADIYADFGFKEAASRDKTSLSYLAKPTEEVWFLMLDSAIYKDNIKKNRPEVGGVISPKTIKWIEACAAMAKEEGAQLVAVMHHNLLDHSKVINKEYTINNKDELLEVFLAADIEIVLTGHIHLQDIKSVERDGKTIYDIATASLAVYPNQYGRMTYEKDRGFEYSTAKLRVESYAWEARMTDENLLYFNAHSVEIFKTRCCSRQNECLVSLGELNEEELAKVSAVVSEMNLLYFAGYRNEALAHLVDTEGYEILQGLSPCFVKSYVENMLNDQKTDNNVLTVPAR